MDLISLRIIVTFITSGLLRPRVTSTLHQATGPALLVGECLLRERWHKYASVALMSGNRNASIGLSFQPISSPTDWLSQKETGIAHSVALFGRGYVQHSRFTCFSCNLMSLL